MKLMKLSIFMIALAFAAGCSKTSSPAPEGSSNNGTGGGGGGGTTTPTYYFSCKVNGVATNFAAMTLIKDVPENPQQIFLVGAKSNTELLPKLTFTLNKTSAGWVDGLTYVMDEKDLTNLAEYESPTKLLFKSTATPSSVSSGLTLHFDKIILPKDQYASGTFSGTLQLEENITSVAITEGKFKVQFMN